MIGADEIADLWAEIESAASERARTMPDEGAALKVMVSAYARLQELGWRPAIYCPKDGTLFDAIEAGSLGIGTCHYEGDWPGGRWWMHEAGDLWPSRPILWRAKQDG